MHFVKPWLEVTKMAAVYAAEIPAPMNVGLKLSVPWACGKMQFPLATSIS